MRERPVRIQKGGAVLVPLGRDGKRNAVVDLEDYHRLIELGVSGNWSVAGGAVLARTKGGTGRRVLIARCIMNALPGQAVHFRNGDFSDLRRKNLELRSGHSKHHDMQEVISNTHAVGSKMN